MKIINDYPNYSISKDGVVKNNTTGRLLTPVIKHGYLTVRLSKNGIVAQRTIHRLVYSTYTGKLVQGMHIDHIDGIRTNNKIDNLRQVSPEDNNNNRPFLTRGEDVNTSKLTETKVMDIRRRKMDGERSLSLALEYGVTKGTINRIASGASWKHLPILSVDNSKWGDPIHTGSISGKNLRDKYGKDYFSKITYGNKFKKHCSTCVCG